MAKPPAALPALKPVSVDRPRDAERRGRRTGYSSSRSNPARPSVFSERIGVDTDVAPEAGALGAGNILCAVVDERRRPGARARETGDPQVPVAAQDVVHFEENGRDRRRPRESAEV
jgi:hypothetical protein